MNVAPTKIQVAAGHSDIRTTNEYCHSENEQVMGRIRSGGPLFMRRPSRQARPNPWVRGLACLQKYPQVYPEGIL